MDKKKLSIIGVVVVAAAVVGVMAFGNFSSEDAAGRAGKVLMKDDGKAGVEKVVVKGEKGLLEKMTTKGEDSMKMVKKGELMVKGEKEAYDITMEIMDDIVIGMGDKETPFEDGWDAGLYDELIEECEEDANGDGISDTAIGQVSGDMYDYISVDDCEDWADSQVQGLNGAHAGGESIAECRESCREAFSCGTPECDNNTQDCKTCCTDAYGGESCH